MNLHEYQAKALFAEYGVPTPEGKPARSVDEALQAAKAVGGDSWIVKAQVHAGGRGKAGGVKIVKGEQALEECAKALLGSSLVTKQSGPDGKPVNCVLVSALSDIESELYLGMLVDRSQRRIAVMASRAGGRGYRRSGGNGARKNLHLRHRPSDGVATIPVPRPGFFPGVERRAKQATGGDHSGFAPAFRR